MITRVKDNIDHRLHEIAADMAERIRHTDSQEKIEELIRMACLLYALELTERELREE